MSRKGPDAARQTAAGAGSVAAGFAGEAATKSLSEVTKQVFADSRAMEEFLKGAGARLPDKLQGNAFEFLETLKFNEVATSTGSDLLARTTQAFSPTGPVDIEVIRRSTGEVVRHVQAKSYGDPSMAIRVLAEDKYHGMLRLVPEDQAGDILARIDARSAAGHVSTNQLEVRANLSGEMRHEGVSSGGTTRAEARFAAEHPEVVARAAMGEAALREVGVAGAAGAITGGAFGLAFATMQNSVLAAKGDKDPVDAMVDTLRATSTAALRGGTVSAGARTIAIMGREAGLRNFAGGTGPVAVANTIFEVGKCMNRYRLGEIGSGELWQGSGGAVLRGSAAYYCGIAGQLLIPIPVVGALAGSLVGYVTSAVLLQSGILGVGPNTELAFEQERRREIEAICIESINRMAECREEISRLVAAEAKEFAEVLIPALDNVEISLLEGNFEDSIAGLAALNYAFGSEVPFNSFEEFDEFMGDPDSSLVV